MDGKSFIVIMFFIFSCFALLDSVTFWHYKRSRKNEELYDYLDDFEENGPIIIKNNVNFNPLAGVTLPKRKNNRILILEDNQLLIFAIELLIVSYKKTNILLKQYNDEIGFQNGKKNSEVLYCSMINQNNIRQIVKKLWSVFDYCPVNKENHKKFNFFWESFYSLVICELIYFAFSILLHFLIRKLLVGKRRWFKRSLSHRFYFHSFKNLLITLIITPVLLFRVLPFLQIVCVYLIGKICCNEFVKNEWVNHLASLEKQSDFNNGMPAPMVNENNNDKKNSPQLQNQPSGMPINNNINPAMMSQMQQFFIQQQMNNQMMQGMNSQGGQYINNNMQPQFSPQFQPQYQQYGHGQGQSTQQGGMPENQLPSKEELLRLQQQMNNQNQQYGPGQHDGNFFPQ